MTAPLTDGIEARHPDPLALRVTMCPMTELSQDACVVEHFDPAVPSWRPSAVFPAAHMGERRACPASLEPSRRHAA